MVASAKLSTNVFTSFVKAVSAPFLAFTILPPANIDFSVMFSNISIALLSLPIPGVISPSSISFIFEVPFLIFLALTVFKSFSALSASSVYLIPLKPIFLIIAGIAAPIASADIPVANPLNTSFAKLSFGSKVCANPAAAPSPIPAPNDLISKG